MMITGGAEAAVTALAIAGFSNMRAVSRRNDAPEQASRPFDKDRDGFVMGEGSGIVILESLESALSRGARIRAEVLGYGMSADAHHMTQPAPGGEGARRAMVECFKDGRLDPSDIGYINSHGTATPHGDIAETQAVKDLAKFRRLCIKVVHSDGFDDRSKQAAYDDLDKAYNLVAPFTAEEAHLFGEEK